LLLLPRSLLCPRPSPLQFSARRRSSRSAFCASPRPSAAPISSNPSSPCSPFNASPPLVPPCIESIVPRYARDSASPDSVGRERAILRLKSRLQEDSRTQSTDQFAIGFRTRQDCRIRAYPIDRVRGWSRRHQTPCFRPKRQGTDRDLLECQTQEHMPK
jgi:hypothetical protein